MIGKLRAGLSAAVARLRGGVVLIAFAAALVGVPGASGVAKTNGKQAASVEQAATIFRKACLQTATSFDGFEAALRANGFAEDGQGYFVDGIHDMAFQIWQGEGRVLCTLFYTRPRFSTAPDEAFRSTTRLFTEIGVPVQNWKNSHYFLETRRYVRQIAKDLLYEHKFMQDVETGHLMRAVLAVLLIFCGLFYFANDIYAFVSQPLRDILPDGASMIATEVASPFLTPFKLSLIMAFFLAGTEPTLPIFSYSQLRFPQKLPSVLALGALILVVSFFVVYFSQWLRRRDSDQISDTGI